MNIVEAIWEKRNLGINTVEVTFDQNDSQEDVNQFLKGLKSDYIVLKIPTNQTDLLTVVQSHGYRYIEDMVFFANYLSEIQMNSVQKRLHDSVRVEKMTAKDMDVLYEEISKGIFDSDRIYLDNYFSHDLARKRYINWIKDEKEKGTEFLKYVYKENTIGFFALAEGENGHFTSFIGGIYREYRKGGLGSIVKVPEEVRKRNGKKVSTSVSTNNLTQIKSLVTNGYIPESISHTFIKHF